MRGGWELERKLAAEKRVVAYSNSLTAAVARTGLSGDVSAAVAAAVAADAVAAATAVVLVLVAAVVAAVVPEA